MVVILHEGKDDKKYIKRLFEFLKITNYTDENFYEMQNKSNFFNKDYINYRILKQKVESEEITKLLFVLDADNPRDNKKYGGKENTIKELNNLIATLDFKFNYEISVICDPNSNEGYFETLLLSCVPNELKDCYQKFIECTGFKDKQQIKTIMSDLHRLANPKKPYTFEHQNFNEIKDFLIKNFN